MFITADAVFSLLPKKAKPFPKVIKNILIIKPDHLGDLLMMSAVLPSIKSKYPDAEIDLLCGPWAKSIMADNGCINNYIIVDHNLKLFKLLISVYHAVQILNKKQYDLCLYMRYDIGNMIPFHLMLKTSYSVGFSVRSIGYFFDLVVEWKETFRHEMDTFISICEAINVKINKEEIKYILQPSDNDIEVVDSYIQHNNIKEFSVIQLGAGDKHKLLTSEQWITIISEILNNEKMAIIFTGTDNEKHLFNVLNINDDRCFSAYGLFTIRQLLVLMTKAKKIFCLESLDSHVAGLSLTPTLVYCKELKENSTYSPEWWRAFNSKNINIIKLP